MIINSKDKYIYFSINIFLIKFTELIKNKFDYTPHIIQYADFKSNKLYIKYIKCKNNIIIEIKPEWIDKKILIKLKLIPQYFYTNYDDVDKEILKGTSNIYFDKRLYNIKKDDYENESYELLRLEIDNFFSKDTKIKNIILNIIDNKKSYIDQHSDLYTILEKIIKNNFNINSSNLSEKILKNYNVINKRTLCPTLNKTDCSNNPHCTFSKNKCVHNIFNYNLDLFINKLINELLNNPLKQSELLQIDDYHVSNIVNREQFTERDNQQIIRENVISFEKSLYNIFGKQIDPVLSQKMNKINENSDTYLQLNEQYKLHFFKPFFIQSIKTKWAY